MLGQLLTNYKLKSGPKPSDKYWLHNTYRQGVLLRFTHPLPRDESLGVYILGYLVSVTPQTH